MNDIFLFFLRAFDEKNSDTRYISVTLKQRKEDESTVYRNLCEGYGVADLCSSRLYEFVITDIASRNPAPVKRSANRGGEH